MFDGTNYNQPCNFAEEIVSYIYEEMNGESKEVFEQHLAKCNTCKTELADFGIVRSQVSDWKLTEFAPLKTPLIQFPVQQSAETTQVKRRWFESLRDLVTLSPAWMTQTAAFASLAICFGLVYFAFFNQQNVINNDDVSVPNDIVRATPKVIPTPPIKVPTEIDVPVRDSNPAPMPISKPTEKAVKTVSVSTPKKVVVQAVQTDTSLGNKIPKAKTVRTNKTGTNQKLTDLNLISNEDDDDDSLRLSDLFEEISMK